MDAIPTAVILAGGQGVRLRSVVSDRPKVLAPVAGQPFVAHLLNRLSAQGCRRAVLCTGYLGDQVESAFGTQYRNLSLSYSREPMPLGTGGALHHARPLLDTDPVLVLNGDSFCGFELFPFLARHRQRQSAASLWLTYVPDAGRYGLVQLADNGAVLRFSEKQASRHAGWINAGVYLLSRQVVESISPGRAVSLERECFPSWIGRGLHGFAAAAPFLDIGTPESYADAADFLARSAMAAK
jgi:NDP-sugar pyrophosphorylase family protein